MIVFTSGIQTQDADLLLECVVTSQAFYPRICLLSRRWQFVLIF
jgi:hypothetical protein